MTPETHDAPASLCRDCWWCGCAVPVRLIAHGQLTELPSPAECPYCGAANPLGEVPEPQTRDRSELKLCKDELRIERAARVAANLERLAERAAREKAEARVLELEAECTAWEESTRDAHNAMLRASSVAIPTTDARTYDQGWDDAMIKAFAFLTPTPTAPQDE